MPCGQIVAQLLIHALGLASPSTITYFGWLRSAIRVRARRSTTIGDGVLTGFFDGAVHNLNTSVMVLGMQRSQNFDPRSVGIIGLGLMGGLHASAVQSHRSSRLTAVADADPSQMEPFAENGVRTYADAAELINDPDIGTVSLCLPHHLHFPIAMQAIAAGKNLLVEKPLAMTLQECEKLASAAAESGITLGVSHNQLFFTAHVEAKRLIEAGAIGDPVHLRLRLGMGPAFGGWRTSVDHTGGGLLMDAGIHRLYMALSLFGPVVSCRAVLDAPREESETFAVVVLEFASGAKGTIEANHFGPPGYFEDEIEVVGTEAALRVPGLESEHAADNSIAQYKDRAWTRLAVAEDTWVDTIDKSVRAFLDAVDAGEPAPVSGDDAVDTMRLLDNIYQSATFLERRAGTS